MWQAVLARALNVATDTRRARRFHTTATAKIAQLRTPPGQPYSGRGDPVFMSWAAI